MKTPQKNFSSGFGFDTALETIDAHTYVLLVSIFEKTPFWPVFAVNNFFGAFKKILTKTTFLRLLFLKQKQQKKILKKLVEPQKSVFMRFETKTLKTIFLHIFLLF